jgi:NitT/TauT family transport system substrate-binding protein
VSGRGSVGRFLAGLAVLVILPGMHPGNGLAAGFPVTVAKTSTGVQLLLVDIASQMGFFAKHGVDAKITIVRGDAESIPALVSGSVQFSVMTSTPALVAMAKGGSLQMIASISTYPEQIVMRKALADSLGITSSTPLVTKLQALRGRTVAILDVGGGLQYTLEAVLASNGIDPKSVSVVAMSPYTAQLAALQRGAVDVIAPAIPYGQVAVAGGYGVMIADVWGGPESSRPAV